MYYKKALKVALKRDPDLKYEGDITYDGVVKFLKDNDIEFTDADGETIKLSKGLTLSVARNDEEPDTIKIAQEDDESEMDGESYDEGDEDEAEAKSRRPVRDRAPTVRGKHSSVEINRAQMPRSKAGSSEIARAEKRYDLLVKSGRGTRYHSRPVFNSGEEATRFGAMLRYQVNSTKRRDYPAKAIDREIIGKATASTIDNSLGGALLAAEEFRAELIDLQNEHGAARQLLNWIPSDGKPLRFPRRTSDVTAYWGVEGQSMTESNTAVDSVTLSPQKLYALAKVTNELLMFADYDAADYYATSMMRQIAYKEDDAYFNGDGTNTYGNIVGLANALDSTAITTGSGNSYGAIVDADIAKAYGTMLSKALTSGQIKWSMTSNAYFSIFPRIFRGLGGTDAASGERYSGGQTAFGHPVVFNNVTQGATASGAVFAYVGDHNMAAKAIHVPSALSIEVSDQEQFSDDITVMKVREYIDINVHDAGTSAGTDSPVVAIKTS